MEWDFVGLEFSVGGTAIGDEFVDDFLAGNVFSDTMFTGMVV